MNIDLTNLIIGVEDYLEIDKEIEIDAELFVNTSIRELKNVKFSGTIERLCDDNFQISGSITGVMVLPDDITLENVDINFISEIEEKFAQFTVSEENNLEIIQNRLDITEFLWQNILVEIPLKVRNEKKQNLNLKGNGWRLVTEEELKNRNSDNSPFSELYNLIDSRKE